MQLGKMYLVKEYFWLLYPTKELAGVPGWPSACAGDVTALKHSKWLSEHNKCNVSVVEENTCFVLLEADEDEYFYKLLDCNGNIGWIYCTDFSRYFELAKE